MSDSISTSKLVLRNLLLMVAVFGAIAAFVGANLTSAEPMTTEVVENHAAEIAAVSMRGSALTLAIKFDAVLEAELLWHQKDHPASA